MNSIFVTGTDTGVGKTLVALSLLYALKDRGIHAAGMKPVAAGTVSDTGPRRNSDALALIEASQVKLSYPLVNPFCFAEPVAPHIAADEENYPIDAAVIKRAYTEISAQTNIVVIEGAGGWLVPISTSQTMADLVLEMNWPVVLVIGLRLGCLNHALLTVESIRQKGATLAGWIGSHVNANFYKADQNIATLRSRIDAPCLGIFPYYENVVAEKMSIHLDTLPFT